MIWDWTETSSDDTGSSQTMNFGLQGQGAGNADALPLAARKLVRIAADCVARDADAIERFEHPTPAFLGRAQAMNLIGFRENGLRWSCGDSGWKRDPGR